MSFDAKLEMYWLPLDADACVVRRSGQLYAAARGPLAAPPFCPTSTIRRCARRVGAVVSCSPWPSWW